MEPRNWANNASATPPPEPESPSEGHPVDGSPQTGVPATEPGAYWFHAVAEEIRNVIDTAGLTPDHADLTQLATAIQQLIANAAPEIGQERVFISNPTFASVVADGDVVYYDSSNSRFDRAIADGTNKQLVVGVADVTDTEVTLYGKLAGLLTGLTPGRYYLSDTTPGAMTTTAPTEHVAICLAKSATEVFVDIDSGEDVMTPHLAHLDPHPQYMTEAEVLALLGSGAADVDIFTASGTYTKPAGLKTAKVTVIGGGGGTGAYNDGSAGGCSIKFIDGASVAATETVTVGGEAGTSSFGAHSSATGGDDEGNPGMGVGGAINLPGGEGDYYSSGNGNGNGGGDSYLCQGGKSNGDGIYGSGAGQGGNGSNGIVIVEEFF